MPINQNTSPEPASLPCTCAAQGHGAKAAPAFSVVIPAHNATATIGDTIRSLLGQASPTPYEIIVVDDGSTDGTADLVRGMHSSVRLITKLNGGPASARNAGILAAAADLVLLLDADDRALPGRLVHQVGYMLGHPGISLSFGNWVMEMEATDYLAAHGLDSGEGGFCELQDAFVRLVEQGDFIPTSTVAVRRDAYIASGMMPEGQFYAEDYALWCRMSAAGCRFAYTGVPLAWYRQALATRLTRSHHAYAGEVTVLLELLQLHARRLPPHALRAAQRRFTALSDHLLRYEWAYRGRGAVLRRIAALEPLLPAALARKWRLLSRVPGVLPRACRRLLHAARGEPLSTGG